MLIQISEYPTREASVSQVALEPRHVSLTTDAHPDTALTCPEPEQARVLLIVGMHRSGTSTLASLLESAGLTLGPIPRQPLPDNERGNFEYPPVNYLNEAIMGPWTDPSAVAGLSDATHDVLHRILRSYRGDSIGIKDPRLTFTARLWAAHAAETVLVGTFRHPEAVTSSLLARDKLMGWDELDPGGATDLWCRYNEQLLRLWDCHNFPLLDFDWPGIRYLAEVGRVADSLQLPLSPAADLLEPSLIHHESRARDIPEPAASIYQRLQEAAARQAAPTVIPRMLAELTGETERTVVPAGRWEQVNLQLTEQAMKPELESSRIASLEQAAETLQAENETLRTGRQAAQQEAATLHQTVADVRDELRTAVAREDLARQEAQRVIREQGRADRGAESEGRTPGGGGEGREPATQRRPA
ncbi:MAG: hypothetical protein GEU28_01600 [Dehalococcoidia bacterium]|nr:hypothetical protein [Dehalococcoidia bacterium]